MIAICDHLFWLGHHELLLPRWDFGGVSPCASRRRVRSQEIAVFAKTSQTHDTTFVPIWAAIWTLTTMIAIFLASVSYLDTFLRARSTGAFWFPPIMFALIV